MADADIDLSTKQFPWLRSGFDLEGWVGALAAILVGILLGMLWDPLFLIGLAAAVIVLFATRTATRTPPSGDDLIVAPCDGLVVSVAGARPADELRLSAGDWTRIRVSKGPTKSNGIYAPMDGAIDHMISETGDPAAFAAMKVDRPGLAVAYIAFESGKRSAGIRFATGGLGPRLEITSDPGDAVRLGRNIGTLRLGGWYDIYVPASAPVQVRAGQTLIGAETVIASFDGAVVHATEPLIIPETVEPEPEPAEEVVSEPAASNGPEEETETAPEVEAEAEEDLTLEKVTQKDAKSTDDDEDVSEMLARLREEARKDYDD
ncbi:MAG: phosphatidylserine decarboxylase [Pseudomonadota bacterium]